VIECHSEEIDGQLVAWRSAPSDGTPILWVHGVPESSRMWTPFLERCGGIAVDLPGFGTSGKRHDLDYSIDGYADFLDRFTGHLGLGRVRLCCHDWGAVALAWAARHPERIERMVAIDVVPFSAEFRWHWAARLWRTRGVGEIAMGSTGPRLLAQASGRSKAWADEVMEHFDQGTQRAILRLYRSADPDRLAAAGARLGGIDAPALVLWGARDRYIDPRFGEELAATLPGATAEILSGAGHWPWTDDSGVIDRVAAFLAA